MDTSMHAPITGDDFVIGERPEEAAARRKLSGSRSDAEKLREILGRSTQTYEAERIRLAAEARERAEREAKLRATEAEVAADLETRRVDASKVTSGIVLRAEPAVYYADPTGRDGMVPFPASTEPPSRGLLPPPPTTPDLTRSEDF